MDHPDVYLPTPEQIKEGCAEIRKGWSPRVRDARWQGKNAARWTVPVIPVADLPEQTVGWIDSIEKGGD